MEQVSPSFLSFSVVIAIPPLLCNRPSTRGSLDDAARRRVLVLVGSCISGHRVSVKQWLNLKGLKPNLTLLLRSEFKS